MSTIHAADRRQQSRAVRQQAQAARPSQTSQLAQTEQARFNIPPQPLSAALVQFSQTTNLDLSFDAALTQGLHTQGISGVHTPEQALQQMLAGTGLTYRFTSTKTVTLERQVVQDMTQGSGVAPVGSAAPRGRVASEAIPLEPVVVQEERAAAGYKVERTTSATKTSTPLRDLPLSIEVIPRQVMEDQGAVQLKEALRNVSGITASESSFTVFADQVNIRGFDASENFVKNGLRRPAIGVGTSLAHDLANIERVEVLKGPASILFGQLEPGGVINIVTKQPLTEPLYAGDLTIGSYNFVRPTVDFSGPLNDSKTVLYRFNGSFQYNEAFLDFFERVRFSLAPVVTVRFTPHTTLTLEGEYLQDRIPFYPGIPAVGTVLPNINGKIPLNRWPGDPPFDISMRNSGEVGYRFEHRFNQHVLLRNAFRAIFFHRDEGNLIPLELLEDERTLTRAFFAARGGNNDYLVQTDLILDFTTGPVAHTAVAGFDLRRNNRVDRTLFDDSFPSIDLFAPTYFNAFSSTLPRDRITSEDNLVGVYVQDQVTLLKNLKLLAGARFDYAGQDSSLTDGSTGEKTLSSRHDTAFSPRVGLVYQPVAPLSLYTSFSRGFEPQPGTTAEGIRFEPEKATQYEVGIKGELLGGKLFATLAFYNLVKENLVTDDPINPEFGRAIGEQRSRGIELDVAGEILPGWSVIASYAYTDAEITKDFSGLEGNQPANVAPNSASLWSMYRFQRGVLQGLGLGAGFFYVGERYGDIENTFKVPDYVRADATILYQPPALPHVQARLTIQNLSSTKYFEGSTGDVLPGAPRSVYGTLSLRF